MRIAESFLQNRCGQGSCCSCLPAATAGVVFCTGAKLNEIFVSTGCRRGLGEPAATLSEQRRLSSECLTQVGGTP